MARKSSVAKLKDKLTAQFGEGEVRYLSEIPEYTPIPSGSLSLDYATGIGGFPNNRVVEIAGSNGVGKSTLSFATIRNALEMYPDRGALYLDVEGRISAEWVKKFLSPEQVDRFIVIQPETAEDATDRYVEAVRSGDICVAAFDSIGGAPAKQSMEKSATIGSYGGNSKAITNFARFAQTYSNKYTCLTIGVNQIREDLAGFSRLITPGGQGWKHATSLRIELKRKTKDIRMLKINGNETQVGFLVRARIHKNSVGQAGTGVEYWVRSVDTEEYGPIGIDNVEELVNLAFLTGAIENGGSGRYSSPHFPNGKMHGFDKTKRFVLENQDVYQAILAEVLAKMKGDGIEGAFETFTPVGEDDIVEDETVSMKSMITPLAGQDVDATLSR